MLCYVMFQFIWRLFHSFPSAQRRFFPVYQDVIHITVCLTSCFLKAIKKLCWRAAAIGRFLQFLWRVQQGFEPRASLPFDWSFDALDHSPMHPRKMWTLLLSRLHYWATKKLNWRTNPFVWRVSNYSLQRWLERAKSQDEQNYLFPAALFTRFL